MEKKFDVKISDTNRLFSSYFHILENLPKFTQFKRDITLNTLLLEGKKIQFDVTDMFGKSSIFGTTDNPEQIVSLASNVCEYSFKVKDMIFIIKDKFVENLLITIEPLKNENGKILEHLLLEGIDLSLKFDKYFYLVKTQTHFLQGKVPLQG
jgi:hypothetical protein